MPVLIIAFTVIWSVVLPQRCAQATSAEEVVRKAASLSGAMRTAFLEEGAKKEGELVFYTSLSLTDYPKILPHFERKYPFVKINTYRSTPSGVFTRADTEARAGRHAVDVVGSAPVEMWELKQRRLSAPYVSPEHKALPPGSRDPEGYWQAFEITPLVTAFNTKQVSAADAPRTYYDLLDPKWKGRLSLGTEEYTWFNTLLETLGPKKGIEYMQALARQELQMPGSSSVMRVQLMLAGESAVAIAARGRRVTDYKKQGAPIDFRIMEPYAGEPNFVALMRRSPHPHAALLFIDWILSEEGQTRMVEAAGRIAIRKGIKHQPWVQELLQKDFVFLSPVSIGPSLKSVIEQYNKIFGVHRAK
ncbi:MAG TPA: extracellular solute-binding protein [candidate division Zixibacteria bacterium]|nr:extracellular solute-binding protein [candidate division Zixibacteria bacterium]